MDSTLLKFGAMLALAQVIAGGLIGVIFNPPSQATAGYITAGVSALLGIGMATLIILAWPEVFNVDE